MKNFGFINDRHDDPKAWNFGAATVEVLQPDGQWDMFLPPDEFQNHGYFEPYACATFGTFNCIETLLRRRYAQVEDYSDRFTAKATGTDIKHGNSPHYVAEWIRTQGAVFEKDYPYGGQTFDDFYQALPSIKDKFTPEFSLNHEYISVAEMKQALQSSPLGVSVCAWYMDEDGYYFKAGADNHWCMVYGYVDGQYWKVFDSYDNSHKKVKWGTEFEVIKRFHIERTLQSQAQLTYLKQILLKIQRFLQGIIK